MAARASRVRRTTYRSATFPADGRCRTVRRRPDDRRRPSAFLGSGAPRLPLADRRARGGPPPVRPGGSRAGPARATASAGRCSCRRSGRSTRRAACWPSPTSTPWVLGVVGWIDLTDPGRRSVLAELAGGALVGIRHQVHDEADPAWLLRRDVQRGLAAVGEAGFPTISRSRPPSCPRRSKRRAATRSCASSSTISRSRRSATATPPSGPAASRRCALPNVSCKLSGLVTEATGAVGGARRSSRISGARSTGSARPGRCSAPIGLCACRPPTTAPSSSCCSPRSSV